MWGLTIVPIEIRGHAPHFEPDSISSSNFGPRKLPMPWIVECFTKTSDFGMGKYSTKNERGGIRKLCHLLETPQEPELKELARKAKPGQARGNTRLTRDQHSIAVANLLIGPKGILLLSHWHCIRISYCSLSLATCHPIQCRPNIVVADGDTVWACKYLQLIHLSALSLTHLESFRIYLLDCLHVSMVSKRLKHMETGLLHVLLLKLNSVFARSFLETPYAASIS